MRIAVIEAGATGGMLTGTPAPASRAVNALLKLLVATMHEERARVVLQRS